jgi:hypothetical protein
MSQFIAGASLAFILYLNVINSKLKGEDTAKISRRGILLAEEEVGILLAEEKCKL